MKQSHHSSFGNAIDLLHDTGTDKHEKGVSLWKSYLPNEPTGGLQTGRPGLDSEQWYSVNMTIKTSAFTICEFTTNVENLVHVSVTFCDHLQGGYVTKNPQPMYQYKLFSSKHVVANTFQYKIQEFL
jgi:hypothetical protein